VNGVVHISERITSLVDGELRGEEIERSHAHLASCPECRHLAEVERLTKARLAAAGAPVPSTEFVDRLLAMGGPAGPLPPRREYLPGSARPIIVSPFGDRPSRRQGRSRDRGSRRPLGRGSSHRPGRRRRPRPGLRRAVVLVGTAALLGLSAGGYEVAGSVTPASVLPGADTLVVESGPLPSSIPSEVFPTAWQQPVSLSGDPEGTRSSFPTLVDE
jgi:anti-sigma factor RsiW